MGILACDSYPSDQGGGTGFRVTAVQPADGASDVAWNAAFEATLSAALDPASLVGGTVNLSRAGAAVPAVVSYDAGSRAIRIVAPLVPGETYQAELGAALRSVDGEPLHGRTWTVTTRPWQPAPLSGVGELARSDFAVGPSGSLHAFGDGDLRPWSDYTAPYFKYVACEAGCADPASWGRMAVDSAYEPYGLGALAVGPSGSLQLVYTITAASVQLRYGVCPSDCLSPASWTFATLDTSRKNLGLAQDGEGVVHLVTTALADPPDTRYGTCQASCADPANWTTTSSPIAGHYVTARALQVDGSGGLHLLTEWNFGLNYSYCPSDCHSSGQWSTMTLDGAGDFAASPSFIVDDAGGVHLIFTDAAGTFTYARCPSACTNPSAWQYVGLGQGGTYGSGFAVDGAGRVTALAALESSSELRFLSCVAGCLTPGNWETGSAGPFDILQNIQLGEPHLTFDGSGRLRVVYSDPSRAVHYLE
jgi:hypothetical protein